MSERQERDVLFPWEVERARRSAEADAEHDAAAAESDAEVAPESAADETGIDADTADEPDNGGEDAAAVQAGGTGQAEAGGVGAEAALTAVDEEQTEADEAARAEGNAQPADREASAPAGDAEHEDDEDRFAVLDTEFARRAAERASAALRDKPVAQKEYYSISEVCELVGLKPHVLRYWETQFHVLNPSKNRSGNRVYQRKEIRLITLVKHLLYEEKYTVEGAKAKLDQLRRGRELADATGVVLDRSMVEQLRADLSELATLLTPPSHE